MSLAVDSSAPRSRPRDRKQRIEEAAALAFARHGYHAVGMQDIAAAVGISAPALYRHFPNKYALFVRTAFALAHSLVEATDAPSALPLDDPREARAALGALLDAVVATTIDLRATGGIYRWEGRYLERDDREVLTAEFRRLRERFERAHAALRPDVPDADRPLLVLGALSAVASISAHRTVVAAKTLTGVLTDAAWRAFEADLPAPAGPAPAVEPGAADSAPARRREQLVESAIRLFASRGYHEVTIEDIAVAVDLTPSGVYRHFDGKAALLLAACDHAAAALERSVLQVRDASDSSRDALAALCRVYVDHTFAHLGLMRVYFSEIGNLAPDEQRRVRAVQRAHIAEWTTLLQAVRPSLGQREATVLVHAGLGVVADQAPLLAVRDDSAAERLSHLVLIVLGVE